MEKSRLAVPHQFRTVRRWLPLIVLGVVLAAVPTWWLSSRQAPAFQVSAALLPDRFLPGTEPDFNDISIDRFVGLSSTWSLVARTPQVLTEVIKVLGLTETEAELAKRVDAVTDANNALLTVTARAGSADAASALANAVADEVALQSSASAPNDPTVMENLATLSDRILDAQDSYEDLLQLPPPLSPEDELKITSLASLITALNGSYSALASSINRSPQGLDVVDPAVPAEASQTAPRALYYTILAVVIGLLLAAGLAFLLQYLDDRVTTPDEVRETTGLRTLGAIRRTGRLARGRDAARLPLMNDPTSRAADVYRTVRSNIELVTAESPIQTLLITSATLSDAKSTAAANLAIAFAQTGRRVVLLDANLRKPALHQLFQLPNTLGLSSLLGDDTLLLKTVAQAPANERNLRVVTSGPLPQDPADLLSLARIQALISRLLSQTDLLIFDGAPLGVSIDVAAVASLAQATVLIIDASNSHRSSVADAGEELGRAGANVIGAVLVASDRDFQADYRGKPAVDQGHHADQSHALEPSDPS